MSYTPIPKNNNRNIRQRRKPKRGMLKSNSTSFKIQRPLKWGPELKYVDTTSNVQPSAAGNWYTVTFPSQGSTSITRVGDRARLRDIEFSYSLTQTSGQLADVVRIVMIQEKGLSAGVPTTASLLAYANPIAPLTYNANELYEVIHDEYVDMSPYSTHMCRSKKLHLSPRIPELRFQAATTTLYSGQIYMLAITYNNTNVSPLFIWRLWFEDTN
jgi:hypothetical protein